MEKSQTMEWLPGIKDKYTDDRKRWRENYLVMDACDTPLVQVRPSQFSKLQTQSVLACSAWDAMYNLVLGAPSEPVSCAHTHFCETITGERKACGRHLSIVSPQVTSGQQVTKCRCNMRQHKTRLSHHVTLYNSYSTSTYGMCKCGSTNCYWEPYFLVTNATARQQLLWWTARTKAREQNEGAQNLATQTASWLAFATPANDLQ